MTLKGNCKESVFKYLANQNRPYSANDVMQNLHKEFGKTAVQKALEDLSTECRIKEKTYGKQKIYSVIQEEEKEENDVALELVTLDSKIEETREKLNLAEQNLKKAEAALKELEKEPSTENALKEKNELETTVVKLQERIDNLSNISFYISDQDKKNVSDNYGSYTKEQRKRKQLCMDIINSIMENYPKKLKCLFDEIGIEPDENRSDSLI